MVEMITYKEFMKKYGIGFMDEDGLDYDLPFESSLVDLLNELRSEYMDCPEWVYGAIPQKILIDADEVIDSINLEFKNVLTYQECGMTDEGEKFIREKIDEYNEKYAKYGIENGTIKVEVPNGMKYVLGIKDGIIKKGD